MTRAHAAVELRSWALFALSTAALAGGVTGVLVKNVFGSNVDGLYLNLAVGLVTGGIPLANLFSVFWSRFSQGRPKVRLLSRLQLAFAAFLLLIAAVPVSKPGMALFVLGVVAAQACWAGVVAVRAVVWRSNFARLERTRFTANTLAVVSLVTAAAGIAIGTLLDLNTGHFRWVFVTAAIAALLGTLNYGRVKVRRQRRLLESERRSMSDGRVHLRTLGRALAEDVLFRRYLLCMFTFGSGNVMFMAPLILIMTDVLELSPVTQIGIVVSIPTLLVPVTMPFWRRLLAARHIIPFRAVHSWFYVAAIAAFAAGASLERCWLLVLGSALLGTAIAGGRLGWNLGHNDFARDEQAADYMGIHMALTGVRALTMPILGVAVYETIEAHAPGRGAWVLFLPLLLSALGAAGFVVMSRRMPGATRPGQDPESPLSGTDD